jgi:hypothetical protein
MIDAQNQAENAEARAEHLRHQLRVRDEGAEKAASEIAAGEKRAAEAVEAAEAAELRVAEVEMQTAAALERMTAAEGAAMEAELSARTAAAQVSSLKFAVKFGADTVIDDDILEACSSTECRAMHVRARRDAEVSAADRGCARLNSPTRSSFIHIRS